MCLALWIPARVYVLLKDAAYCVPTCFQHHNQYLKKNGNLCFCFCFRFEWDKLLENVHCLIISVTKTDKQEAYILR